MSLSTHAPAHHLDTLRAALWDEIRTIEIPMGGHYGLDIDRSYSIEALCDLNNPVGIHARDAIRRYIPRHTSHDTSAPAMYRHIIDCLSRFAGVRRCPHCRDAPHRYGLADYYPHQTLSHIVPDPVSTCSMHPSLRTPLVYGINIPSGHLVIANDLRGLIHHDPVHDIDEQETKVQAQLHAYAQHGLLYLLSMNTSVSMTHTHTKDAYAIGHILEPECYPSDAAYDAARAKIPAHLLAPHADDAPLAEIGCSLCAVCIMDGDHVTAALARMHPNDAERVRKTLTIIPVTPGYYTLTMDNSHQLYDMDSTLPIVLLARADDHATHPIVIPHTYTMHEAINYLNNRTIASYDYTPFTVWNRRIDWAIGCPTGDNTGGMGSTPGTYAPISSSDIMDLTGLYALNPRPFDPWEALDRYEDARLFSFAPLSHHMAPEAIACWIAGADATMHGIRQCATEYGRTQHDVMHIQRIYQDFRDRLWGAAHAHHCTDTVLTHLDTLRGLIAARMPPPPG